MGALIRVLVVSMVSGAGCKAGMKLWDNVIEKGVCELVDKINNKANSKKGSK